MALDPQVIDSINDQLEKFGDDGTAFERWMDTISDQVRAHGDVGAFRTQARGLWLSNNKKGVKKLVSDLFSQPTIEERRTAEQGELAGDMFDQTYIRFLQRMGIHRGDTLTVHDAGGSLRTLTFDDERLPARTRARTQTRGSLITEPAPTPGEPLEEDDE